MKLRQRSSWLVAHTKALSWVVREAPAERGRWGESERGAAVVVSETRTTARLLAAGHTLGAAPDVVKTTSSHAEDH